MDFSQIIKGTINYHHLQFAELNLSQGQMLLKLDTIQ